MSDVVVAADAGNAVRVMRAGDSGGDLLVTAAAGALRHALIARADQDVVGETARGERQGMEKAVLGLDRVLADEIVGGVAVVAGGDGTMAAT